MKRLFTVLLLIVTGTCFAGIPHPEKYEWGTLTVPENYALNSGQKLQIYWEKLKSSSTTPEAIILLNGGPGMTHDGFHQATANGYKKDWFEALRTHFDIYYFDQRGTGKSSPLSYGNLHARNYRTYGAPDISRDIEELRKNVIKKEKIAVLGESYGGMAALSYATMFPESVSKLIIHDSSPSNAYFTQMHLNFSNGLSALDQVFPGVKQNFITSVTMINNGQVSNAHGYTLTANDFLTIILSYTYSFRGQYIISLMASQIVADGKSAILDAILGSSMKIKERTSYGALPVAILLVQGIEMLDLSEVNSAGDSSPWSKAWLMERIIQSRIDFMNDYGLTYFSGYNVISQLGKITSPALVVVGETDFICPPAYAQIMYNGISDCRLLRVKNAAHGGFVEQNEFVVGKVRSFLLNHYPGKDEHLKSIDEMRTRDLDEMVEIWLEGARRLGLTAEFLKK